MAEENIVTAMLREDGQLIESDDESSQGRTSHKRRSIDMLEEEHDRRNPVHRDSDRDTHRRAQYSSWRPSQVQSEAERQDAEIRFRDKKKNVTKRMINDSIKHLQWNVDEAQYLKKRISMVENRSERLIEGLSHLVKVMDTDKNDPNMLVRDCPERFRAILNGHARQ